MSDAKTPATDSKAPSSSNLPPPPIHPEVVEARNASTNDSKPAPERPGGNAGRQSSANWAAAGRFLSAYAQTWVGMSPLWLMDEAIVPGQKVGGMFKRGAKNLQLAAVDIRDAVAVNAKDIVVIIDQRMQQTQKDGVNELAKAGEVIKAAGENALLVVTTSLEKAQHELQKNKDMSPKIKRAVQRHSRDVIVVIDQGLRNPIVVTGINQFAKSKGIPHADALLRLASLALAKIIANIPEVPLEGVEAVIQELDAAELERASTQEAKAEAEAVGKNGEGPAPKYEANPNPPTDPYAKMRKENECIVM